MAAMEKAFSTWTLGEDFFYLNPIEHVTPGILSLDVLLYFCAFGTFVHAVRAGWRNLGLYMAMFIAGTFVEEASVNNGVVQTHCHADGFIMVTKCSSLNSVLFYPAWMYIAMVSASRMRLPWYALPSAAALLQGLYGVPYEMQGPAFGFWQYTAEDVAKGALADRLWGMPLMAAYFHPAMGFGSMAADLMCGFTKKPGFGRWVRSGRKS
jgi:hypothetical protein